MGNYYDWKSGRQACPKCNWSGPGSEAAIGETFNDGAEYHCPKCDHRFGFIAFPLLTESISDPRAPNSDRAFAEIALRGAGKFQQDRTETSLAGQRVYEDESFILLKSPWLLVITHPFLARYFVYLKGRHLAVSVQRSEKRFLLAVLGEMVQLGLSPRAIKDSSIFKDFCQAIPARGGALWHVFFRQHPARELAKAYARA